MFTVTEAHMHVEIGGQKIGEFGHLALTLPKHSAFRIEVCETLTFENVLAYERKWRQEIAIIS